MRRLMLTLIALLFAVPLAAQSFRWEPIPLTYDLAYYDAAHVSNHTLHILLPAPSMVETGTVLFTCDGQWRVLTDSLFDLEPNNTGKPVRVLRVVYPANQPWKPVLPHSNAVQMEELACGKQS